MVQLVLADEDRELVQVQHVVGVRCDLVWKKRQKASLQKMTLLFAVINYFPPPLLCPERNPGQATKKGRHFETRHLPGIDRVYVIKSRPILRRCRLIPPCADISKKSRRIGYIATRNLPFVLFDISVVTSHSRTSGETKKQEERW